MNSHRLDRIIMLDPILARATTTMTMMAAEAADQDLALQQHHWPWRHQLLSLSRYSHRPP
jgi:hypothetical protein